MNNRFDFLWSHISDALIDLKAGKIEIDKAKAVASLAKQGNNTLALQFEIAKFIKDETASKVDILEKAGLETRRTHTEMQPNVIRLE